MGRVKTKTSKKARHKTPSAPAHPKKRRIGRPAKGSPGIGRELLLSKTAEMLSSIQPSELTLAKVAVYAHVDPALIRYYFKDRESLLVAVAEKLTSEFAEAVYSTVADTESTAVERLRARVMAFVDLNAKNPFFHRLMNEELAKSSHPGAKKLVDAIRSRGVKSYAAILADGVREGTLRRVEPTFLLLAVIGICEYYTPGITLLKSALPSPAGASHVEDYKAFVVDLLLNGLMVRKP